MKIKEFLLFLLFSIICFCSFSLKKHPYVERSSIDFDKKWDLVWNDEFRSASSIDDNWIVQNASPKHILSSRWKENIEVRNGCVVFNNRKENRGGKEWTTGSMTCKKQFQYGFFECKMKISAAYGTNNSFWFYQWNKNDTLKSFEIDVVEGHYPNDMNSTLHNHGIRGTKKKTTFSNHFYEKDLSKEFHIYGLLWDVDSLKFYLDGIQVWSIQNSCCFQPANMVLGTAVLKNTKKKITDEIDGTSMIVDYVRVWKLK
ncbi:MAG: glycoside hydrolase family 16 protein [Paludibacteraceae bacterium]|nr:glycoside hydrolase family 16 protein [Paludibacteraceae bacterium]